MSNLFCTFAAIYQKAMKKEQIISFVAGLLTALSANAQCKYCNTYEDFLNGRWQDIDTVYCDQHSKGRQFWWGGNDYTLSTGNKALDKKLKKEAFIVMQADTMYLNCRNLRYEDTRFGNGYTKTMRIGERSLLFVNRMIGREALTNQAMASFMFGALGSALTYNSQMKKQVCYVISWGADANGHISIRLINDALMDQMIVNHNDLHDEYYSEEDTNKRLQATHVVPILEKAGLFN